MRSRLIQLKAFEKSSLTITWLAGKLFTNLLIACTAASAPPETLTPSCYYYYYYYYYYSDGFPSVIAPTFSTPAFSTTALSTPAFSAPHHNLFVLLFITAFFNNFGFFLPHAEHLAVLTACRTLGFRRNPV